MVGKCIGTGEGLVGVRSGLSCGVTHGSVSEDSS
jgi:hypothetical protein